MPKISPIYSTKVAAPVGLYPHARRVGNFLFLSGVGPLEKGIKEIPGAKYDVNGNMISYDIAIQCHTVFKNVRHILEESGSNWNNIVDITVFLTNLREDFETYNHVYASYFKDVMPCRTTVGASVLPLEMAIEVKVIATID